MTSLKHNCNLERVALWPYSANDDDDDDDDGEHKSKSSTYCRSVEPPVGEVPAGSGWGYNGNIQDFPVEI